MKDTTRILRATRLFFHLDDLCHLKQVDTPDLSILYAGLTELIRTLHAPVLPEPGVLPVVMQDACVCVCGTLVCLDPMQTPQRAQVYEAERLIGMRPLMKGEGLAWKLNTSLQGVLKRFPLGLERLPDDQRFQPPMDSLTYST